MTKNAPRTGAPVGRANQAAGGSWLLIGLAAAAVIVGIILIADGDDEKPASP